MKNVHRKHCSLAEPVVNASCFLTMDVWIFLDVVILNLTQNVRLLMADHMLELFSSDSLNYLRAVTFVQPFLNIICLLCVKQGLLDIGFIER